MEIAMTRATLKRYQARMQRVLDHIDRHLDDDLGLDTLSNVAAFSKHHFHRQFQATFGLSVLRYVQLVRMKRASYGSAFRDNDHITEIALNAGHQAPEAFARAFKQRFGQAPRAFRKARVWETWLAAFRSLTRARTAQIKPFDADQVHIIDAPATPVALMEHKGDPALLGETIRRFIAWRKRAGLRPNVSATYTIFHVDPETAQPEDYHIDLCAATERPIAANDDRVIEGLIPAGRCAVLRVTGSSDDLRPAALYLYTTWLPHSGEEARDFPLYARRLRFFPDVPEHEAVTDLFLPLQ
jgi:AraC family transcriptional regulator